MNNNYLEKNLAALKISCPEAANRIRSLTDTGEIRIDTCRKVDCPTIYVKDKYRTQYLHSRMDPIKEARRFIKLIDKLSEDSSVLVFGLGLAYHVEELLRVFPGLKKVLVIECNIQILRTAMSARDMTHVFGNKRLGLIIGPYKEIKSRILSELDTLTANRESFKLIVHPPSLEMLPESEKDAKNIFEYMKTSSLKTTSRPFEKLALENIRKNYELIPPSRGISIFKNRFKNIPAIMVAAGPSLDRNAFQLQCFCGQALLICVDAALKPLLVHGGTPHFTFTSDPQPIVKRYFEGCAEKSGILLHPPEALHEVIAGFDAHRRFAAFSPAYEKETRHVAPHKNDFLQQSPSVYTSAIDFAVFTGANPIILIGSDLSFSQNKTHASASRGKINSKDRFSDIETVMRKIAGFLGGKVHTSLTFYIYLKHIENYIAAHPETKFINATEGGAFISGCSNQSLKRALFPFKDTTNGITDILREITVE